MIALIVAAVYIVSVGVFAVYTYRSAFCWKNRDLEYTKNRGLEKGDFDQAYLDKPWREFEVKSPNGYHIACVALEAQSGGASPENAASVAAPENPIAAKDAPVAIFVHGISWTRYGMYKYMKHFSARGWTVVALDLPGHGKTWLRAVIIRGLAATRRPMSARSSMPFGPDGPPLRSLASSVNLWVQARSSNMPR